MTQPRFTALDVFRGLTICLMIIVNTPGDGSLTFAPLHHAKWHGFTPTDLVFPSFLFAVGNALSLVSLRWPEQPRGKVLGKIFKRSALIFVLGFLMYWFPFVHEQDGQWVMAPFSGTRILGVLQRIALCYCAASLLVYCCKKRTVLLISVGLLLGYWALCVFWGDDVDPFGMTTNIGYHFDLWLMGPNHMYHGEGQAFDPEGWISTLPAIVNVTAGYFAGLHLQKNKDGYEGLTRLLLAGFACVIIAYFWNFLFPINKKLWTSSFVMQTVGLDCMLLAAVVYLMRRDPAAKWPRFFEIAGRNPLAIYLFSELLATLLYMFHIGEHSLFVWIYQHSFAYVGPYWGSLLFAVAFMLVCWSLGYWMDKRKLYLRA